MNELYHRLGLVDYLTIKAQVDKKEFTERLKDIMDIPFHTHRRKRKRLYEGEVFENEFTFRRKKGFLGLNNDPETRAKVVGTMEVQEGQLVIKAKIIGQTRELVLTWGIGAILIIISFIINLLILGILIFFIAHRHSTIQKGVAKLSRTVDLEFDNLIKKNAPQHRV